MNQNHKSIRLAILNEGESFGHEEFDFKTSIEKIIP